MKILCKCGNIFDFAGKNGTIEGFDFMLDPDTLNFCIHCNKCDKTLELSGIVEEEIDDYE